MSTKSHLSVPGSSPRSIQSFELNHWNADENFSEAISKTLPLESKIKHQIHNFTIDLDLNNTIFYKWLNIEHFPKRILVCLTLVAFVIIIACYLFPSLMLEFLGGLLVFIICLLFICRTNIFIIKEALKSFIVWYKCVHTFIAILSRSIYFNFWLDYDYSDISTKDGIGNAISYFQHAFLFVVNVTLFVFCISIADGIKSKGNRFKRLSMIIILLYLAVLWMSIYFNLYGEYVPDKDAAFSLVLFGDKRIYYWRSIALTSHLKLFFLLELNCIES